MTQQWILRAVDGSDISSIRPSSDSYFGVRLIVESSAVPGAHELMVCSPSWFEASMTESVEWGTNTLWLGHWSLDMIDQALEAAVGGDPSKLGRWARRIGGEEHERRGPLRATIRHLISPDLFDLRVDKPEDPARFYVLVQVLAGPSDGPGEESFQVLVASPEELEHRIGNRWEWGRHRLVAKEWKAPVIEGELRRVFEGASGGTWRQVAEQLAEYGLWEFEDYRA